MISRFRHHHCGNCEKATALFTPSFFIRVIASSVRGEAYLEKFSSNETSCNHLLPPERYVCLVRSSLRTHLVQMSLKFLSLYLCPLPDWGASTDFCIPVEGESFTCNHQMLAYCFMILGDLLLAIHEPSIFCIGSCMICLSVKRRRRKG